MIKYIPISFFLKRIAYIEVNKKIKLLPKKLQLIADFLKKEPISNFISELYISPRNERSVIIPLTMNKKAIESFKKQTSEFPDLFKAGQAGQSDFNLIYMIGQLLTDMAMLFDIYYLQEKDSIQTDLKKLYKIWGSHKKMSGRALSQEYHLKKNIEAKKSILLKLNQTINLLKEEIIPNLEEK